MIGRYHVDGSGRGLRLVPSLSAHKAAPPVSAEEPPMPACPSRGTATLWEQAPEPDASALTALLGAPRTTVLSLLAEPLPTVEIARRLGVTPSAVSQHLEVLHATGLVTRATRTLKRGFMIDLRRLHVLRAVAHYGTVTAVARALHFTPSAASQQIRQLARDLGVDLLEPQGRGIRLTPAAESLLAHADAIQARWEQAELDLRADCGESAGPLRMSGFPLAVSVLPASMAARLRARHPRLDLRIQEAEVPASFDLLFEGEIDLAIVEATVYNPPLSDARFDQQPLLDDPFDLVVPEGHPLAGREDIDLAQAAHEDWIAPVLDSPCRPHVLPACGEAGFTPNVVHHAMDWNVAAHLVAHRLGVALIPRLAQLTPHLPNARVRCTGNPHRKLLTRTRRGGRARPAIVAALQELREPAPTAVA